MKGNLGNILGLLLAAFLIIQIMNGGGFDGSQAGNFGAFKGVFSGLDCAYASSFSEGVKIASQGGC